MDQNQDIILDDDFMFYSLIYSAITILFAIAVLSKFLTNELRFGIRSILILALLFIGEPVCHFLLRGAAGSFVFGIGCLFLYSILPASHFSGKGKSVLITGCDSGFGHALAKKLDSVGMIVYAGCLQDHGPGAIQLMNSCSENLHIVKLDITKDADVQTVFEFISLKLGNEGLWGLVNAAGIFYVADLELTAQSIFDNVMNVNFMGLVRMTKTFLPLIRRSRGRIVNVANLAGQVPIAFCGAYTASMHAVHGFSDVLRMEMKRFHVNVSVVDPGAFKKSNACSTSLKNKEHVWTSCTAEVQSAYGREYMDRVYQSYEDLLYNVTTDITPVIRAMKSGLLSKRPREYYACGRGVEMLSTLYPLFPVWLSDRVMPIICPIAKNILPQCLQGSPEQ